MGIMTTLFGGKTKTKNSFEPYSEAKPFLLGDEKAGTPGIFDESARLYGQGGFTPQMQDANSFYLQQLQDRSGNFGNINDPAFDSSINPGISAHIGQAASDLSGGARDVANGAFDTDFNPVSGITSQNVDLNAARRSQGVLDPTYVAPTKPREGDLRLADGTSWNPGSGAGFYGYYGSAWVKLG